MGFYEIIETDAGYTIVEVNRESPKSVAIRHHGTIVDPGPYRTYEEAYDAILALQEEDDEEAEEAEL